MQDKSRSGGLDFSKGIVPVLHLVSTNRTIARAVFHWEGLEGSSLPWAIFKARCLEVAGDGFGPLSTEWVELLQGNIGSYIQEEG